MDFGGEESDKENEDHPKQFKRTQTLENSNSIHENIHQQNKR